MSYSEKRFLRSLAVHALLLCTAGVPVFAAGDKAAETAHFGDDAAALYRSVSQIASPAGSDVLYLENQETLVFDSEGKTVRSRYRLYKILTQKGAEQFAEFNASWEPWHEDRPGIRARVITSDNAVHVLDESTITDAPAKETEDRVFSNRRVIRGPLPAIGPGSLVEEEETTKESSAVLGAGTIERFYFSGSVPVQHSRLVLDAPSGFPIRYALRLLPDLKPERTEADGRVRIVLDYGRIDAIDSIANDLPSDEAVYPSVVFSTGNSWQQVAEEYGKIVEKRLADADLKSVVATLVSGKKSRADKITAILQHLDQEVRYTGVEFGDAAIVPNSPTETLTRKYGDCKDKATLLVAMLRTAGIPAYVALLNAGSREDVAADLPGLGMFDHAIVYAPGSPDLWIDATDEYARLGELPSVDQERWSLVVRPGTNALLRTPTASSADNLLLEKRDIHLAENGPARIIETTQPHGSVESPYRRKYADKEDKQAKDGLSDYMKSQYLAEKLDRLDRSDPKDLTQQFELVLESDKARRGVTELDSAAAAIRLEHVFGRLPGELQEREKEDDPKADTDPEKKAKKKRTADYELPIAFVTEWQYTITPPVGFRAKPLPQNVKRPMGPALLTEDFSTDHDGAVHATIRFDTVKRRLTVGEATELRNAVAQQREGEAILIYFEPIGQALLSQGKVREALQSYRDLIALHPKEAVHHLQMAGALLAAGMGETARSEGQTAVKLEPDSALAEKTLADILEYDLVGRRLRPGSDYAGAEAAYRAAEKLDPDDKANVANLALLLEYNRWGLRYGPGANLKGALTEYRKLTQEKLAEFQLQNNIAYALFYDGQFEEARKNAASLNPQPVALIVACEAALNGTQAALTEAKKRTGGEEQFKKVAESAGDMLVNLRKYPLAADLEDAGASGDNASDTVAFAALYRKTIPHEQFQLGDDPAGAALRFELLSYDSDLSLDQLRSNTSRNGKTALAVPDVLDSFVKGEKHLLTEKARQGHIPDVGEDLSFTRAQPKVQGSDATGYKVTLWPSAKYKSAMYVVREDGHYKVLATSRWTEGIGLEALDRIAANDPAGARALFDWLREDEHLVGGDDPLSGAAFPRFWTKGKDADAAAMRLTAASILAEYKETAAQGIAILEAAKASARNDTEKLNIALALVIGYGTLENFEKAALVGADLAQQYPESEQMFLLQSFYLRALGRLQDADKFSEERLKRMPGDLSAMRTQAWGAIARENYAGAYALDQKIVAAEKAEPQDLNSIAWHALFTGKVEPADVENAIKAAQLTEKAPNVLHTLGCVYAEAGKTKEAREVLVEAMDSLNLDEPDDNYWYAFGRIAEQYGERSVAIANYERVSKPKRAVDIPDSSYRLAQIRLQVLHNSK